MSTTPKELIFETEARSKLREGVDKLAEVVAVTLGPKGRSVALQASFGSPTITNDGNSVIKTIELKDPYENMGASLAKQVASTMKEKCGDGTTTAVLLLASLVRHGIKNIVAGSSAIGVKRGIDKAISYALEEISKYAIPIKDDAEMRSFAGEHIAAALQKVGKTGVITIEEGKGTHTVIETVEGMQFDRGYCSAYFCTDSEAMMAEIHDVRILVTDKKISSIQELLPILQQTAGTGSELLLIADDIEGDALSTLVVNKLRGTLKVCAVKAPGFGDRRKALLQDIAILTGATFITEDAGISLKDVDATYLGKADKTLISKDKTTLIGGQGASATISARIQEISVEIQNTTSTYDKEKLEERKAKLAGGVAVIRVGAPTEAVMKQEKQKLEDRLSSTKAALEEGIVAGGGVALLHASRALRAMHLKGDEAIGVKIVAAACEAPFRHIVSNAGYDPSLIINELSSKGDAFGFNVLTERVEDMLASGIADAAKVIKCALEQAGSSAGIICLSEVLIGNAPEEQA